MVVGEHVRSSPRGHDGDRERFRKRHEALRGACSQHPTPATMTPRSEPASSLTTRLTAVRSAAGPRAPASGSTSLIRDLDLGGLDILRDGDEDGARPTRVEASMGLGHDGGGLIGFIDLGGPCGQDPIPRTRSASWNASRPRKSRSTCPTRATSGAESAVAVWMPMAALDAPTARETATIWGRPVDCARASAMKAAPDS